MTAPQAGGADFRHDPIARLIRWWVRLKLRWFAASFRARGQVWEAHRCDLLRASIRAIDHPGETP